jgi:hypothetical protein
MTPVEVVLPDPAGETYEDGSRDFLIAYRHPAEYPTDAHKITLCANGCEIDLDETQLGWIANELRNMRELIR